MAAEVLDSYDWGTGRTRASKYPWEQWMDGKTYKIKKGIDFESSCSKFIQQLRQRASDYNARVNVANPDDETIVFQYLPREETELEKLAKKVIVKSQKISEILCDATNSIEVRFKQILDTVNND